LPQPGHCRRSRQPFGTKAKEHLAGLIFGMQVRIETHGKDRYGRTIGTIYVGQVDANLRMVDAGLAWSYRRYSSHDSVIEHAEEAAKVARRGLWADPSPEPPWDWRSKERGAAEGWPGDGLKVTGGGDVFLVDDGSSSVAAVGASPLGSD
jgi:endonuclease YncB( thermonuclease family)